MTYLIARYGLNLSSNEDIFIDILKWNYFKKLFSYLKIKKYTLELYSIVKFKLKSPI